MTEGKATEGHEKQILFVCTANICRSPIAEAIFNALAEDSGLGWRARSAGVAALEGEGVAPLAQEALEEVGIYPGGWHSARQVSGAMLDEADLVLAMTPRHDADLRRYFGALSSKFYTLREYATGVPDREGIPDPYGHTMTAYRASVRQLFEHVEGVLKRLERGETFG